MLARVAAPGYQRADDRSECGPERAGNEDAQQRSLIGLGRQDERAEKPGGETDQPEYHRP